MDHENALAGCLCMPCDTRPRDGEGDAAGNGQVDVDQPAVQRPHGSNLTDASGNLPMEKSVKGTPEYHSHTLPWVAKKSSAMGGEEEQPLSRPYYLADVPKAMGQQVNPGPQAEAGERRPRPTADFREITRFDKMILAGDGIVP